MEVQNPLARGYGTSLGCKGAPPSLSGTSRASVCAFEHGFTFTFLRGRARRWVLSSLLDRSRGCECSAGLGAPLATTCVAVFGAPKAARQRGVASVKPPKRHGMERSKTQSKSRAEEPRVEDLILAVRGRSLAGSKEFFSEESIYESEHPRNLSSKSRLGINKFIMYPAPGLYLSE